MYNLQEKGRGQAKGHLKMIELTILSIMYYFEMYDFNAKDLAF